MALGLVFSVTQEFVSRDTAYGKKIKCKVRLVVDAEKHKTGLYLLSIPDRATNGAECYKKY